MSIYLAIAAWQYLLPLLLTGLLAWLVWRHGFRRRPRAIPLALGIAILLSCWPAAWDRLVIWRDLAALAQDEIRPERLALPPGPLLHLQNTNVAGVTCDTDCPFDTLPFASAVTTTDLQLVTSLAGDPASLPLDLWAALPDPDRSRPFPYRYVFISGPDYWYAEAMGATDYRMPHWPESSFGLHMLAEVPPDGLLDLAGETVLYRRFNIQEEQALWGFWGFASKTLQQPSPGMIFSDLRSRAHPL